MKRFTAVMSLEPTGESTDVTVTSGGDLGLEPGTVLDDKFRVVRMLGIGGMGAVYEVEHELTRHRRALKLLHMQHAARKQTVNRFLREASAAGRIGNPHIVETFDAGWLNSGEPYVVMEMLVGQTLKKRISEVAGRGLPGREAAAIMAQVCEGVAAAHQAGIVHRDLKPDNIFLSPREDGGWFVKLLDFGISKFDEAHHTASSQHTAEGSLLGTPAYMSPEQFEDGANIDERTDVYALGVILWEVLAGVHPYPARTLAQLARKIVSTEVPPITERHPALPTAFDDLLWQMLCQYREERVITAEAAAHQLAHIAEMAPITGDADPLDETQEAPSSARINDSSGVEQTADAPMRSIATGTAPGLAESVAPDEKRSSRMIWGGLGAAAAIALAVVGLRGEKETIRAASSAQPTAQMTSTATALPPPAITTTASASASATAASSSPHPSTAQGVPSPPPLGRKPPPPPRDDPSRDIDE